MAKAWYKSAIFRLNLLQRSQSILDRPSLARRGRTADAKSARSAATTGLPVQFSAACDKQGMRRGKVKPQPAVAAQPGELKATAPVRGTSLWDGCGDAQIVDGIEVERRWDLAAQLEARLWS